MNDDQALRPGERIPLAEVGKHSVLIERGRDRLVTREWNWTPSLLWDEEWEHMLGGTDLERSGTAIQNLWGKATWIDDDEHVEISLFSFVDNNNFWFEWRYLGNAQDDQELLGNLVEAVDFYRGIRSSLPDYSRGPGGIHVLRRNINGIRVGMVIDGPIVWTDSSPRRILHHHWSACIMDHRQFSRLPTLGGPQTVAIAINDRGRIIGHSMTQEGITKAVCWVDQEIQALPNLGFDGRPYGVATTWASAINRHDQVVGWSTNSAGKRQAVHWIDGQIHILSSEFENSLAAAINDVGQIIGTGWRDGEDTRQFLLWSEAKLCEQLNLPDGAHVINRDGLIAGTTRGSASQAFVWHDGEMVYLPILAPYESASVTDINDRGDVAGCLELMLDFEEENGTGMPRQIPCVWLRTPRIAVAGADDALSTAPTQAG